MVTLFRLRSETVGEKWFIEVLEHPARSISRTLVNLIARLLLHDEKVGNRKIALKSIRSHRCSGPHL